MTLGADIGLGGGGEGKGGVASNADDARQSQRLMPWEGSTFRTPSVYEMAFCACEKERATTSSKYGTEMRISKKMFQVV